MTPVWVDADEKGTVRINTARGRLKDRLLALDAPAAPSAVNPENPYEYVQVRGRVSERRTSPPTPTSTSSLASTWGRRSTRSVSRVKRG